MDYSEIKEKMSKTISVFAENLAEVRAGRANPAILNKIKLRLITMEFQLQFHKLLVFQFLKQD